MYYIKKRSVSGGGGGGGGKGMVTGQIDTCIIFSECGSQTVT